MTAIKLRRFSPGRWKALAWYRDHALDRNSVMKRPVPTVRMRNRMLKAGQLAWVEGYMRAHPMLMLTEKGQALLRSKHKRLSEHTRATLMAQRLRRNTRRERRDASRPETAAPTS
jgi:hypothetical protein